MSSTKRGGQRSEADNYPTPPWAVHRFLEDPLARRLLPGGTWLEPGAGDGSIIRAVNQVRSDINWTAYELREECRTDLTTAVGPHGRVIIDDFVDPKGEGETLWTSGKRPFSVSLGNPPFWLAHEFIERSLAISDVVALLLRLNYVGSKRRHAFMRAHMPDAYVLPDRPMFRGNGTDSIEYAWLVFSHAAEPEPFGMWKMLNTTPVEVRRPEGRKKRRAKRVTDQLPEFDPGAGFAQLEKMATEKESSE